MQMEIFQTGAIPPDIPNFTDEDSFWLSLQIGY